MPKTRMNKRRFCPDIITLGCNKFHLNLEHTLQTHRNMYDLEVKIQPVKNFYHLANEWNCKTKITSAMKDISFLVSRLWTLSMSCCLQVQRWKLSIGRSVTCWHTSTDVYTLAAPDARTSCLLYPLSFPLTAFDLSTNCIERDVLKWSWTRVRASSFSLIVYN